MSNAVYPTLPGIMQGTERITLAPTVHIRTTPSQREFRARDATLPRYQYTVKYELLRSDLVRQHLQTLVGFFNARGGSFDSFLFTDPIDSSIENQLFGTGNGTTAQFQLLRGFGGFAEPIFDLNATARVPSIYVDGVLKIKDTHYTQSPTGLITFTAAPSAGMPLTWSGDFYRRVRFLRDQLDTSKFLRDFWDAKKVELLSTKA